MTESSGLEGQVVLVTGGSRGIGAATARAFAREGARVIVTHRDSAEAALAVVESLAGEGHRVVQAPALDSGALREAARSVESIEGRLDVLVNNAAMTRVIPHHHLDELDDELFDTILATNVRGVFATVRACRDLLDAGPGGVVVNISSLAGRVGNGSNVAYCASKAAVDNMTQSLARALAPQIRVLSVAPGLIDTDFTGGWHDDVLTGTAAVTPLKRLATVDDVAEAVLVAATRLKSTTGVVIPVDGGRPLV